MVDNVTAIRHPRRQRTNSPEIGPTDQSTNQTNGHAEPVHDNSSLEQEIREARANQVIENLNQEFAFITIKGKVAIMQETVDANENLDISFMSKEDFRAKLLNRPGVEAQGTRGLKNISGVCNLKKK